MNDKVPSKEEISNLVQQRASHAATLAVDGARSRSYFFPVRGVFYLVQHTNLWPPVLKLILPCTALSAVVVSLMFFFTYVPQAAILTLVNGPAGPFSAIALVLSESSTIINWIARTFLLQDALVDLFDATLVGQKQEKLVENGRELKQGNSDGGVSRLGKAFRKPVQRYLKLRRENRVTHVFLASFTLSRMIEYLCFLPLNLIPVVGTAVFLVIQGRKTGPDWHSRYFQLKGFSKDAREDWIAKHRGAYIA